MKKFIDDAWEIVIIAAAFGIGWLLFEAMTNTAHAETDYQRDALVCIAVVTIVGNDPDFEILREGAEAALVWWMDEAVRRYKTESNPVQLWLDLADLQSTQTGNALDREFSWATVTAAYESCVSRAADERA